MEGFVQVYGRLFQEKFLSVCKIQWKDYGFRGIEFVKGGHTKLVEDILNSWYGLDWVSDQEYQVISKETYSVVFTICFNS